MHPLIRTVIPAILFVTGCDVPDDAPESAPILVGDRVQELAALAGLTSDQLSARRPTDDGAADDILGDLALHDPSEQQAYCQPYDFQECRNTCGIFGQYCFVCEIADDGFPIFYCAGGPPKKY